MGSKNRLNYTFKPQQKSVLRSEYLQRVKKQSVQNARETLNLEWQQRKVEYQSRKIEIKKERSKTVIDSHTVGETTLSVDDLSL